jgi:hypothetical protein
MPKVIKVELIEDSEVVYGTHQTFETYEITYDTGEINEFFAESCELACRYAIEYYNMF